MQHLQRGQWDKAITGLEEVLRLSPGHRQAATLLEQARLKASLDRVKPRGKRVWPTRLVGIGVRMLLSIVLGLALGAGALWIRSRWLQPVRASQEEVRDRAQQLAQAQTYLAEQDYTAAREAFEALLAQTPGDERAQAGLQQLEQEIALDETYGRATGAIARLDWNEALRLLDELSAIDPEYRDVRKLQAVVREQQQLSTLFEEAEGAHGRGDWTAAMGAYESLMDMDPEYQQQEVTDHLSEAYLWQGVDLVEETRGTTKSVQEAVALFRKALAIKPQHPQLVQEVALAQSYLEAEALLAQEDMEGAIARLEWVQEQRPLYAGGKAMAMLEAARALSDEEMVEGEADTSTAPSKVSESLSVADIVGQQYAGLMRQADQARAAGEHAEAEAYYRRAMAIGVPMSLTPYVRTAAMHAELGDYERAVQTIRMAFLVLRDSEVTLPTSSCWDHTEQAEHYAEEGDHVKALAQYDTALLVFAEECDCGVDDWRVLP
jgi:tetratricopeptide (TPR) repeat protein